jgi:hypothetical protein
MSYRKLHSQRLKVSEPNSLNHLTLSGRVYLRLPKYSQCAGAKLSQPSEPGKAPGRSAATLTSGAQREALPMPTARRQNA